MEVEDKALEALEQYADDLAHNIEQLERKLKEYKIERAYVVEALNDYIRREVYKKCITKGSRNNEN